MIFATILTYGQYTQPLFNKTKALEKDSSLNPPTLSPHFLLSEEFYSNSLGFFCKKELKLQSIVGFPIKFRLGNVQYCDWLEGKKAAGLLPVKN